MTHALILDANQRSALAVTRSLAKKGVPVITADETPDSLAGSSRYSQQYIQYPSATNDSLAFIHTLAGICLQYNINLIFLMTELTMSLLLKHRAILPDVIMPFADGDSINALSDKCKLMRLARSLQIPIPQTWHIASREAS